MGLCASVPKDAVVESPASRPNKSSGAADDVIPAGARCDQVYTFGKELGSGAYSTVYLAKNKVCSIVQSIHAPQYSRPVVNIFDVSSP